MLEEPAAVGNGSDYYYLHKVGNYLKKPAVDVTFYQIFFIAFSPEVGIP